MAPQGERPEAQRGRRVSGFQAKRLDVGDPRVVVVPGGRGLAVTLVVQITQ